MQPAQAVNQGFCESVKAEFIVAGKVATNTDGLRWSSRLVQRIVDIVVIIFGSATKALATLGQHAGALASLVELVEPIKRGYQIIKTAGKDVPPWAEITALSCTFVYRVLTGLRYLHEIGVPYLSGFYETVGSYYVLSPLSFVGNVFDITANSISANRLPVERETAEAALEFTRLKQTYVQNQNAANQQQYDHASATLRDRVVELESYVGPTDARVKNIKSLLGLDNGNQITRTWAVFSHAIQASQQAHNAGDARFLDTKSVTDITRWEKEIENTTINRNKAIIAIISAITKIAIITLASIGSWAAVSALVFSGPICVVVGFIVALCALTKVVYNARYDEERMRVKEFALKPEQIHTITPALIAAF